MAADNSTENYNAILEEVRLADLKKWEDQKKEDQLKEDDRKKEDQKKEDQLKEDDRKKEDQKKEDQLKEDDLKKEMLKKAIGYVATGVELADAALNLVPGAPGIIPHGVEAKDYADFAKNAVDAGIVGMKAGVDKTLIDYGLKLDPHEKDKSDPYLEEMDKLEKEAAINKQKVMYDHEMSTLLSRQEKEMTDLKKDQDQQKIDMSESLKSRGHDKQQIDEKLLEQQAVFEKQKNEKMQNHEKQLAELRQENEARKNSLAKPNDGPTR
jgi:hypothetical protein